MANKKIGDFELIDHGIDGSQYFPGCGTTFTDYSYVATGCGDNPREALDDLIDMIGQMEFDVENLHARIMQSEEGNDALVKNEDGTFDFPELPSALTHMLEANGFSDEEPIEPDRDSFKSDDEYDDAMAEYEEQCSERNELVESSDVYYYLSLRWNETYG